MSNPFKSGDLVTCTDAGNWDELKLGEEYRVVEISVILNRDYVRLFDSLQYYHYTRFELLKKLSPGDKVTPIDTSQYPNLMYGDIYTVEECGSPVNLIKIKETGDYCSPKRFKKMDDSDNQQKPSRLVRMLDEIGYDWKKVYNTHIHSSRSYLPYYTKLPEGLKPKVKELLAKRYDLDIEITNTIDSFMKEPFP